MTDVTETDIVPAGAGAGEVVRGEHDHELLPHAFDEEHVHPGPRQYVLIAIVLVVLTAVEVGFYYLEGDVSDLFIIISLWVLAAVKFFLVCSWYMHMRMDAPFFRRAFVVGILLAGFVYGVALLTFASSVL